ncbi:MAG: hypothetical protein IKR91_06780, partial [Alloprevotella sp.]|nr:hypothetical protein [Alloprevotella sp.]
GDKVQAANVAREVARQNSQYLTWLNSLSYESLSIYPTTCARLLQRLYQAEKVLEDAGSKDAAMYKKKLEELEQTSAGNLGKQELLKYMSEE